MEHDLYLMANDFWHKRKINNLDLFSVFLAIATNITQRLMAGFVLQGNLLSSCYSNEKETLYFAILCLQ